VFFEKRLEKTPVEYLTIRASMTFVSPSLVKVEVTNQNV
jgi:hypothetical protein